MKGGEEKKAAVAVLVFIIATLEIFGRKILFWQKYPFGGNVISKSGQICNMVHHQREF